MDDDVFDKRRYSGLESEEMKNLVEGLLRESDDLTGENGDVAREEYRKLLLANWPGPESPLKLKQNVARSVALEVRFVENSRIFLKTALEEEGIRATEAGNIEVDFVYEFLDAMDFGPNSVDSPCEISDYEDETEARPLHILRVVLEVADLLTLNQGVFLPTEMGEKLLNPRKAAELMRELFVTYFRDFNLAFFTRGGELPQIQALFPHYLYRLSQLEPEEGWQNRLDIVEYLIPSILQGDSEGDEMEILTSLFSTRVLDPLAKFGLLDARGFGVEGFFQMNSDYCKTELFDRFLEFDFS